MVWAIWGAVLSPFDVLLSEGYGAAAEALFSGTRGTGVFYIVATHRSLVKNNQTRAFCRDVALNFVLLFASVRFCASVTVVFDTAAVTAI